MGLGEEDTEADYAAPSDDRSGYGGFDNHDPSLRRYVLPLRRGDSYLAAAGASRVDVIKIDVEGYENHVVAGLAAILRVNRPALLIEYWPDSWTDAIERWLPSGYRVWWLKEGRTQWLFLNRQSPSLAAVRSAPGGSIVLALPLEWSIPEGLRLE